MLGHFFIKLLFRRELKDFVLWRELRNYSVSSNCCTFILRSLLIVVFVNPGVYILHLIFLVCTMSSIFFVVSVVTSSASCVFFLVLSWFTLFSLFSWLTTTLTPSWLIFSSLRFSGLLLLLNRFSLSSWSCSSLWSVLFGRVFLPFRVICTHIS